MNNAEEKAGENAEENAAGTPVGLPGLPVDLAWLAEPGRWDFDGEVLTLVAPGETDLFTDPQGKPPVNNAPALVFEPEGDFVFSAKVKVAFKASFDAGVLLVYQRADSWAKLCFEYEPQGFPLVVSVVTKGTSDDCNSLFLDENTTYLRVARLGQAYAFHHSFDGADWHLIRVFALEPHTSTKIGLLVQSPVGEGCSAEFYRFGLAAKTLPDIRSGE